MRVWLAPSAFAPHRGGVEEVALRLAQHLQAAGDEVLVVTNRWPLDLPEQDVVEGVDVMRLPFALPAARPSAVLRFFRERRRHVQLLEELKQPDVVHVHCASSQLPTLGAYTRRRGVRLVLSTHGETAMDAQGLFQHSAFMRWSLRHEATHASALTACSAWAVRATASVAPVFARAEVVLNGVDMGAWPQMPVPEEPVLAAWGRHVPQKGFDLLLRALPLVRQVEPRVRLLLGGAGEEAEHLRSIGVEGVDFVGPLDRPALVAMLRQSRVVVVPSRVEPFGLVAVEALAAGRGLVYARGTGLTEASGGLGRAVDVRNPTALAEALVAELRDPTPAAAGRAWAASLDWSRVAERYRSFYLEANFSR
ncbi:glycosyltransferase family 4 protein [Geodermatophilus sp. SYSU D01036]